MTTKSATSLYVLKVSKAIENSTECVLKDFFIRLSECFSQHIAVYEKTHNEMYELGLKVVDSLKNIPNYLYYPEQQDLENARIMGNKINKFAEKICTLKYDELSQIFDYLRTPLTNYLKIPSKLLLEMQNKSKNLESLILQ